MFCLGNVEPEGFVEKEPPGGSVLRRCKCKANFSIPGMQASFCHPVTHGLFLLPTTGYICGNVFLMIQRIQTLFLLVATTALVVSYFIPFGYFPLDEQMLEIRSYGVKDASGEYLSTVSTWWFHIPLSLVVAANLWTLFQYNRRRHQILILRATFVLFAVAFVLLSMYIYGVDQIYAPASLRPGLSVFLLFAGLLLNWLAARAIRKDEELIRSVDRIR